MIYKGILRIIRYLFHSYKSIFVSQTNEYALIVEWNCTISNVQHVENFIRDLDIDLEVYYMSNGIALYFEHILYSLMQLDSISMLKIIILHIFDSIYY